MTKYNDTLQNIRAQYTKSNVDTTWNAKTCTLIAYEKTGERALKFKNVNGAYFFKTMLLSK